MSAATLEEKILASVKHANCLLELFELLGGSSPRESMSALHALRRVFVAFLERGDVGVRAPKDDAPDAKASALATYRAWLREQHARFATELCGFVRTGSAAAQVAATRTLLQLVQRGGDTLRATKDTAAEFGVEMFAALVKALVRCVAPSNQLLAVVRDEILSADACVDSRYYFLKSVPAALGVKADAPSSGSGKRAKTVAVAEGEADAEGDADFDATGATANLVVLLALVGMPTDASVLKRLLVNSIERSEAPEGPEKVFPNRLGKKRKRKRKPAKVLRIDMHRKAFSAAWSALLTQPLALGSEAMEAILVALPLKVIPHLDSPVLLRDLLADTVIASRALKLGSKEFARRSEPEREAAARCDLLAWKIKRKKE